MHHNCLTILSYPKGMNKEYMPVSKVTPDNYYDALRSVQNAPCNQNRDITTFTAFLNWDEKLTHYSRYLAYALKG